MSKELDLATQYRHHAKNLLAAAQFEDVEDTHSVLVKIAHDFTRMAADLEAVDEANRLAGKAMQPRDREGTPVSS